MAERISVNFVTACMAEEPPRESYAIKYACMYVTNNLLKTRRGNNGNSCAIKQLENLLEFIFLNVVLGIKSDVMATCGVLFMNKTNQSFSV